MESKIPKQLNMDLPPYTAPKFAYTRKNWILAFSLGVLLTVIIVAGILFGVFMTQKHTEQLVTVAFSNAEGKKVEQTIFIDENKEVATVYVNYNKNSTMVLYDYDKKLIAFRKPSSSTCFVMKMEETKTPALGTLLKGMEYFHTHNATDNDKITYNIVEEKKANPAELGSNVYLLCSDTSIYWAKQVNLKQRKLHGNVTIDIHFGCFHIACTVNW